MKRSILIAGVALGLTLTSLSRDDLGAQTRTTTKTIQSDPALVYSALSPLLEYQRRFFERRMIDPSFLTRFNDLVRAGDFQGAATFVAHTIGVSGAAVVVRLVPGAPPEGPSGVPSAKVCFGVGGLQTCSEWS